MSRQSRVRLRLIVLYSHQERRSSLYQLLEEIPSETGSRLAKEAFDCSHVIPVKVNVKRRMNSINRGPYIFTRASYLDDRLRAKLLTWFTTSREHSSKEFITVYGGLLSSPALTHSKPALFRPRLKATILLQLYATIQVGPA